MNVIDSYLDTLFSPYPDSPRLREARAELREMMEDKQQALREEGQTESQAVGQVIAEFGSLEEVAPELGISSELGGAPAVGAHQDPRLDLDRARAYVELVRRTQWMTALAVPMFVLAAAPLLLLIAITGGRASDPPMWAVGTGLIVLLLLVSLGVLLLVQRSAQLDDYEDIRDGRFTVTTQVSNYAREIQRSNKRRASIALAVAIMLWIMCAVPTIIAGLITEDGQAGALPLYGVSLTLAMIALGLWILLREGWSDEVAEALTQQSEDEEMPENSTSPTVRVIAALYWPVAVAIYLAWSFLSGDWHMTWVIWPVAGVLYAGLWSLNQALGQTPERSPAARGRA